LRTEQGKAMKRFGKQHELYAHAFEDLPESTLWKWMEDLTMACMLIAQVEVGKGEGGKEKVKAKTYTMVDRDFKYDNVFLDLADEDGDWPSYPVARLGDFGMAIYTWEGDPNNPVAYNYNGCTHGWLPPELDSYTKASTLDLIELGKL